eukprot:CAMPEP_0171327978 /NCGR_PEP_ID=MMETSP0878-20121228/367_1 /TAXON_ID=67004 /ORGANISM="Thalassiosira weissflogii, Strain CCMP1336" /LENGTH=331 /DNA_ID=CAMNT_0011827795 /DNA_START=131 /DNA_END=1129 /DNA_ORIENTATION=-
MVTAVDENAMRSNDDFSSSSDNDLANIANKRVKRDEFGYDSVDSEEPTSSITDSNDKPVATAAKGKGKGKGKARAKKSPAEEEPMSKAREVRLEQNRKAARESRRRKKVLQEELQRSVIFFSRANGTLKQQNEELQRMLNQARAQVAAIEVGQTPPDANAPGANDMPQGQWGQQGMNQFNTGSPSGDAQQGGNNAAGSTNNSNGGGQPAPAPMVDANSANNQMMNWMNFQAAAMAGGLPGLAAMGIDPNSPYAQALSQFAMQQQQGQGQMSGNSGSNAGTPNPLQFPFGMPNQGMFAMPFGGAPWGAGPGNMMGMGNNIQNSGAPGAQSNC